MKRSSLHFALSLLLVLGGMSACKTQYDLVLEGNDVDLKYKTAFDYFNAGKYTRSSALFESLTLLTNGTERYDTVMYYLGLSNYSYKDYYTAETNFDQYLTNFPQGAFAEMAQFLRIDCLYRSTLRYELDQTPTYTAITAIGEYLREHPEGANSDIARHRLQELGDRLDRKAYENAKLYYKMEDYKAARVALKNVLKEDADNIYREDILYYSAMASYKYADMSVASKKKERFLVFQDDYLNFIGEFPESHYRKELDGLYEKVKEKN
ncbi:MAG: outer membrane protein assembly factor BamD [Bacteroidales bacterium]|nr:outer membrane protein assembly factor BamD [Bacteroidales bacterium]MDY6445117.1 outer membrane protein assembly factor BamD [Bacteroidales bacterium]